MDLQKDMVVMLLSMLEGKTWNVHLLSSSLLFFSDKFVLLFGIIM